ncbi:hypothetical protein J4446_00500 [Candidatus Woesearchaeota archaeon]|nr:hypothetical protein [Candidatus Woesearchaeota archaeon]
MKKIIKNRWFFYPALILLKLLEPNNFGEADDKLNYSLNNNHVHKTSIGSIYGKNSTYDAEYDSLTEKLTDLLKDSEGVIISYKKKEVLDLFWIMRDTDKITSPYKEQGHSDLEEEVSSGGIGYSPSPTKDHIRVAISYMQKEYGKNE